MSRHIYVNEVMPNPAVVTIDLAGTPELLARTNNDAGFIFSKALDLLDVDSHQIPNATGESGVRLAVSGSVERLQAAAPRLQSHIGGIAIGVSRIEAGRRNMSSSWASRLLGSLVTQTIPGLKPESSFMHVVGSFAGRLADTAFDNDEAAVHYGEIAHWRYTVVQQKIYDAYTAQLHERFAKSRQTTVRYAPLQPKS
jgi:hypothetical protein